MYYYLYLLLCWKQAYMLTLQNWFEWFVHESNDPLPVFSHQLCTLLSPFSLRCIFFPPLSSLPLICSLVPWLGSDWHLQITPRWRHCVWPFSLSSPASLPFCHLITVNPWPVPRCWIFNGPASLTVHSPNSTPLTPSSLLFSSPPSSSFSLPTWEPGSLSLSLALALALSLNLCVLIQSPLSVFLRVIKVCPLSPGHLLSSDWAAPPFLSLFLAVLTCSVHPSIYLEV